MPKLVHGALFPYSGLNFVTIPRVEASPCQFNTSLGPIILAILPRQKGYVVLETIEKKETKGKLTPQVYTHQYLHVDL